MTYAQVGYIQDFKNLPGPAFIEGRPWGAFLCFGQNVECTAKVLSIEVGGSLSAQFHRKRDQLYVVHGTAAVTWSIVPVPLDMENPNEILKWWSYGLCEKRMSEPGDMFWFPRGVIHRVSAIGGVTITEVAYGENDEEDIARLLDEYGRADEGDRLVAGG